MKPFTCQMVRVIRWDGTKGAVGAHLCPESDNRIVKETLEV